MFQIAPDNPLLGKGKVGAISNINSKNTHS